MVPGKKQLICIIMVVVKTVSVCKQKGNRLANHRGIYIGKCLKKNKEKYDEAILLQIRRA